MAAGVEVFNTSGHILIDSTYKNLSLAETHDIYVEYGASLYGNTPNLSYYGENPVVAVGETGGIPVVLWWTKKTGNTYSYYFSTNRGSSGWVRIYIFDAPDEKPKSAGLQVFSGSGELVFDSDRRYLKPLEFWSVSIYSKSKTFNRRPIAAIGVCNTKLVPLPPPVDRIRVFGGGISISGNRVDFGFTQVFDQFYGGQPSASGGQSTIMVCDASAI